MSAAAPIVILDDRAARRCAKSFGLTVKGTIGVVLAAKEAKRIPLARPILNELRQAGLYISNDLFDLAVHRAGE